MKQEFSRLFYEDVYFYPVKEKNINLGWLNWMNNTKLTRYLDAEKKNYKYEDLKNYLASHKSYFFLACYRKIDDVYLGNLRIYQYSPAVLSYGLLIGEKYHRLGYGTKFCKLALDLCFNWLGADLVVASAIKENVAPTSYKTKLGFHKIDDSLIVKWGLEKKINLSSHHAFYMDKKTFYKTLENIYKV